MENTMVWQNRCGHVTFDGPYHGRALRKYRDSVCSSSGTDFGPGVVIDVLMDSGWNRLTQAEDEDAAIAKAAFMLRGV